VSAHATHFPSAQLSTRLGGLLLVVLKRSQRTAIIVAAGKNAYILLAGRQAHRVVKCKRQQGPEFGAFYCYYQVPCH
jgi:hypothetical protein